MRRPTPDQPTLWEVTSEPPAEPATDPPRPSPPASPKPAPMRPVPATPVAPSAAVPTAVAPGPSPLPAGPPRILRVTDLNRRVRSLLDADAMLADVWVEGEVSQPSYPPSGHCFFTLKDSGSQLRAVLFRDELERAMVRPEHGMAVICHGRVRVYEAQGTYQLYVESITPAGAGDLHARYEQLRARLAAEGLFDESRRRPLPRGPWRTRRCRSSWGSATNPTSPWPTSRPTCARRHRPPRPSWRCRMVASCPPSWGASASGRERLSRPATTAAGRCSTPSGGRPRRGGPAPGRDG